MQRFVDGCFSYIVDTNEPNDEHPSFTHGELGVMTSATVHWSFLWQ